MAASSALYLLLFHLAIAILPGGGGAASSPSASTIPLESSISPSSAPAWLSPSGRFAFGFYPAAVADHFYVGAWLLASPEQNIPLWTANRDRGPVGRDAAVRLTRDGLVLLQTEAEDSPISTAIDAAASASVLDSGNFVIYDADRNVIWDWETYGPTTDTVVSGQFLNHGSELVSNRSETDPSAGRFRLKLQDDGNLVLYPVNTSDTVEDAYWASHTSNERVTSLYLDDDGTLALLTNFSKKHYNLSGNNNLPSGLFYRARLDFDGIFRLYSHDLHSNRSEILASFPDGSVDRCSIKGTCGVNSYCILKNQRPVCVCLPGFVSDDVDLNLNLNSSGCKQTFTSDACPSEDDMEELQQVAWFDDPYQAPFPVNSAEDCAQDCLQDCNCNAAFYKEDECSKQKFPLKYGRRYLNESTVTFVKVGVAGPQRSSGRSHNRTSMTKLRASLAVNAGFLVVILVLCFLLYRNRARNRELDLVEEIAPRSFRFRDLKDATDGFKQELGRGAFGTVFRGVLRRGGRDIAIAVKRLKSLVGEGEREFRAEMAAMGRAHHKNLVKLIGFCCEGSHRLLVYEYMSNGSLADHIFFDGGGGGGRFLEWSERVRITLDVAKGLHYLHEECESRIIHFDIKPENILMDDNRTAKISDFGLAKLLAASQTRTFTEIRGTRGYLAPEWQKRAPVSAKADVYSFGVVLLEILCCRKSLKLDGDAEEILLVEWVNGCFERGELGKLLPEDEEEADMSEVGRLVKAGLWCTQTEPAFRPSMKKAVMMLEGIIDVAIPPPLQSCY